MMSRPSLIRILFMDLPNCIPIVAGGALCMCGLMLNAVTTLEWLHRVQASTFRQFDHDLFKAAIFGNALLLPGIMTIVVWIRHLQHWYGFKAF